MRNLIDQIETFGSAPGGGGAQLLSPHYAFVIRALFPIFPAISLLGADGTNPSGDEAVMEVIMCPTA